MSVSVNLYWVILALVVVLGSLSLLSHFVVRRHVALLWLAAALGAGSISTFVFIRGGVRPLALATLAVADTLALYLAGQAVRLVIGKAHSGRAITLGGAALTILSLGLIATNSGSVVVQALPFQIAGALFIGDALVALARARKGMAEWAMLVGLAMNFVTHATRMPFFPSLLDSGRAYPSIASPWLNWFLLTASSIFVPLVVIAIIARDLGGHIEAFRETSKRDGLTGLLTRLAFEHMTSASRPPYGALVVCDLDHFKQLNDTYGHPAGDEALRAFARLCASTSPIAGRIGGEEFAILLPGKTLIEAEAAAARIRAAYANSRPAGVGDARLSASFGIAAYGGSERFRETLIKADRALYRAKRQGRDCIVIHGTFSGEDANPILRIA